MTYHDLMVFVVKIIIPKKSDYNHFRSWGMDHINSPTSFERWRPLGMIFTPLGGIFLTPFETCFSIFGNLATGITIFKIQPETAKENDSTIPNDDFLLKLVVPALTIEVPGKEKSHIRPAMGVRIHTLKENTCQPKAWQ